MDSYLDLAYDVLCNGEEHADRTGVGTVSVFGRQWRHDMRTGFPLLTTKKVPMRWCYEEVRWMLSGSRFEADLAARGVDIWKEWATPEQCAKFGREPGDLGPIYGPLMRRFPIGWCEEDATGSPGGPEAYIDQITQLINDIQQNPASRRLIVTHWHPYYQRRVELPPCHTLWQCKTHGDAELSLHLYCRSIDLFLGLPFDIAFYGIMLHLICNATGRTPRDLIISFGDLHIYRNHIEVVKKQLKRKAHSLPTFSIGADKAGAMPWDVPWDKVRLEGYRHWPKLEADVAI